MIIRNLARQVRELSWDQDPNRIPSNSAGFDSWAGVPITEVRALQQITVHSCVGLIADTIATLPVGAFRKVGGSPAPVEPPSPFLEQPHAEQDRVEWLGRLLYSILLRGNAYGRVIDRDRYGFPAQIMPLHPDECDATRDKQTGRIVYRVSGERNPLQASEVFHVKGLTPPGSRWVKGLSPIEYIRQTLGATLGAEEFAARFFGDGAQPTGVLKTERKLTPDEAKGYQDRWIDSQGNRRRKPAVMGQGLDWKQISISPNESQFLETIKAKRSEIAGFYRVPPHMIGDTTRSTSWGTGIEEQMLGFITFCLGVWIVKFERAMTRLLPKPQYVRFNVAGLLRGRLTERYRGYLMGRQGGWLDVDEIRDKEEMPPLPDGLGQVYNQPMNWGPLGGTDASGAPVDGGGAVAPGDVTDDGT